MGSSYALIDQVQQWLDTSKLTISELDPNLVETAQNMVFARVSRSYNTTGWLSGSPPVVDQSVCPALVQKAVSLLIASWMYNRAYSEITAENENKYALRLETMAEDLTAGIEAGIISLTDADPSTYVPADQPDYMPGIQDNSNPVYDALGRQVGYLGSNDVKFRMSQRF